MKPAPPVTRTRTVRGYRRSRLGTGGNSPLSPVCKEGIPCGAAGRVNAIPRMTISKTPEIQSRPEDAGQLATAGPPWPVRARRAVAVAAALAGLVAICAYLAIALSRLTYPFTIEWLESNSLVEVHRVLAGQPLYTAPTAGYV